MKNILLELSNEIVLVFTPTLTVDECAKFAEITVGEKPRDQYEVENEMLQYHSWDSWVSMTRKDDEKARLLIAKL